MIRVTLSPAARADIAAALRHSRATFGPAARARYARLIERALSDLADHPGRAGVRTVSEGLSIYHLRSAGRGLSRSNRAARPRHLIVFRHEGGSVNIVRALDDRMDIPAHLG